jgi:hypothetical protein
MADNYIKDTLKDVLRHTHGLGFFEMVKISGTTDETLVETVNTDKTVIMKATLANPVPDFVNATVGLSRMGVLQGYIQYPDFDDEAATVHIVTQDRNGEKTPSEVEFVAVNGTTAHYRFMLADVVNQQLKDIKFKGSEYDVSFTPSVKNLKDLAYFNGVLSTYEANFIPKTEKGLLYFYIGDNSGDRSRILIAEGVKGDIKHEQSWPLDVVLKILRLGDASKVVVSINSRGLLQIVVNSGLGEYTFYLPAGRG